MDLNPVSVLFTREQSVYDEMGLDTWPKSRDAANWPGGNPIIAHPPCAQWSVLKAFAHRDLRQKAFGPWSVMLARQYGGVVEHPFRSALWKFMKLPGPGLRDQFGQTVVVDQYWFGHRAQKRTLLYVCGHDGDLPGVPLVLGDDYYPCQNMGTVEREKTPRAFGEFLYEIASNCLPLSGDA